MISCIYCSTTQQPRYLYLACNHFSCLACGFLRSNFSQHQIQCCSKTTVIDDNAMQCIIRSTINSDSVNRYKMGGDRMREISGFGFYGHTPATQNDKFDVQSNIKDGDARQSDSRSRSWNKIQHIGRKNNCSQQNGKNDIKQQNSKQHKNKQFDSNKLNKQLLYSFYEGYMKNDQQIQQKTSPINKCEYNKNRHKQSSQAIINRQQHQKQKYEEQAKVQDIRVKLKLNIYQNNENEQKQSQQYSINNIHRYINQLLSNSNKTPTIIRQDIKKRLSEYTDKLIKDVSSFKNKQVYTKKKIQEISQQSIRQKYNILKNNDQDQSANHHNTKYHRIFQKLSHNCQVVKQNINRHLELLS